MTLSLKFPLTKLNWRKVWTTIDNWVLNDNKSFQLIAYIYNIMYFYSWQARPLNLDYLQWMCMNCDLGTHELEWFRFFMHPPPLPMTLASVLNTGHRAWIPLLFLTPLFITIDSWGFSQKNYVECENHVLCH